MKPDFDCVIVGSGIAGIFCAKKLTELGLQVLVISKDNYTETASYLAQGGIAGAISPEDSPKLHYEDTVRVGRGITKPESVWALVEEGVERIVELVNIGVPFEREKDGTFKFTRESAHSYPRILYCKDETGKAITETLVKSFGGKVVYGCSLKDLIVEDGRCFGVVIEKDGKVEKVFSLSVVLATGGCCGIYEKSSNPRAIGDATAIALLKGAELANLEFVQFHPTANCVDSNCFLVSESVRGEGAILIDGMGNRFMEKYHPLKELAPRDVVARAIEEHRRTFNTEIFIDFSPIAKRGIKISERFPHIYKVLKQRGFDPEKEPVPITPVAHYHLGGIKTDTFGRTTIKGLYAVGECACTGCHGANRLASNSLLECLVFANRTAYRIYADTWYLKRTFTRPELPVECEEPESSGLSKLKKIMWDNVGITRTRESLERAIEKIGEFLEKDKTFPKKPAILGISIAISALERKESRGCHFRKDFPEEREDYKRESTFTVEKLKEFVKV